ncbi:YqgE/AlgH family protein [Planctomicrobium sp. SH664]|uniref:YqgE/AlgH family protein n=1 Tax=Planctomicrobium sp. SH664 TaxID=3448125 RepID=UPI003F5B1AC7
MRDPNFFKTVVLIVEHGPDGAMGLVVNRPSAVTVSRALTGHLELPQNQDPVYLGGPVEPAALFVIHDCEDLDPTEDFVVPGIYMGSSTEVFESIVSNGCSQQDRLNYRVYCGCAGWSGGQLEGELERGDWLTIPADPQYVFHSDPYAVWDDLLCRSLRANRILPQQSEHPEWN